MEKILILVALLEDSVQHVKIKPVVCVKFQGTHLEYMRTPIVFFYHLIYRLNLSFLYKNNVMSQYMSSVNPVIALAYFSVFFAVYEKMLNFLHRSLLLDHKTMVMHTTLNVELNLLSWSLFSQGQIWLLVFVNNWIQEEPRFRVKAGRDPWFDIWGRGGRQASRCVNTASLLDDIHGNELETTHNM